MRFNVILNLFLLCSSTMGQGLHYPVGAGYVGIGAYTKGQADAFSVTQNVASASQIKELTVGLFMENRFLLTETNYYSGSIILPTSNGNFGFLLEYLGFKNYNEWQAGFSYARSLGKFFNLGVKFNFYQFQIPEYITAATVDAEIGIVIHVSDKLHAGIDIYNPAGGYFEKRIQEKLPSIYKLGAGYDVSEHCFLSAEIFKEENQGPSLNTCFEYNFKKQFFWRGGYQTATSRFYTGCGVSWKNFRADVSVSFHPQLGISPGVMIIMTRNNSE